MEGAIVKISYTTEVKTSLVEKVLLTLHNNEFMDFFQISKIAWFCDENVKSATFSVTQFLSDPAFLFVTCPFLL